ncbi:MAG: hypothetical protein GWP91_06870, partial [Rhodobacterales bacterium]|nr:hypothetical protein [Rhodobacterales bacterium]
MNLCLRLSGALALAAAPSAFAQDLLEYRDVEIESDGDKPFQASGSFESSWHEYNNLDFRQLDETSDQSILDSDDRGMFPFTGASLGLTYQVDPGIKFVFGASHRGLWGSDQLGTTSRYDSLMYVSGLYIDALTNPKNEDSIRFRVGRQYYQMGNLGGARDYILADVLDMIRMDVPLGEAGTLELIPVNVLQQSDNDGNDMVSLMGTGVTNQFNFRGQTLMRRHGGVLRLDGLPAPVDLLAYGFYTDIGAGVSDPSIYRFSTGVDITYQGLLGNFIDEDWVMNYGARVAGDAGPVNVFAHFDGSGGIDRKELVAQDVDTTGFAWGAGAVVDTSEEDETAGFTAQARYFEATGAAYSSNGLQFSHGYVGLKGQQVGGMLFNRYMGFHPTAYVSIFGISETPHEPSRKAGTRVLHGGGGYEFDNGFSFGAAWWMLHDTGFTNANIDKLDEIDPP